MSAVTTANEASCHFRFQALPEFFFDYLGAAQRDSAFRATTLPALGLIDRQYDKPDQCNFKSTQAEAQQPWQRLQDYVEYLNRHESGTTTYKVLYITRHGLGYHNIYESKVGTNAWDVSIFVFYLSLRVLTVARITGHTWTEMARSFGPTLS